jgi:O-antigen/teichoic acid export membrane protein
VVLSSSESSKGSAELGAIPKARHPLGFSSAGVFTIGLVVQVVGFVGSVILYKLIGVSPQGQTLLGTVQLFFLIGASISSVGDLRMGSAYTFFIARGKSPLDNTSTYLLLRFAIAAGAAVLILGFASFNLGGETLANTPNLWALLAVFLLLPFIWSVPAVFTQLFVAQGDSVRAQYPSLVEVVVRTPLLLVVALWAPTLWGITFAYVLAAFISALYSLPAILPNLRRFRRSEASLMFRFAWPLMGSLALTYVVMNSMPFVVAAAAGVRQLNIFNAANGFRLVALSFATAVATPLFPLISGLHHQKEYREIRIHVQRALRFSAMVVVPVALGLAVFSSDLLRVFTTPQYLPGANALSVLSLSVIPASLSTLIFTALVGIGRQRLELFIAGVQTLALFLTVFLLLPPVSLLPAGFVLLSAAVAILVSAAVGFGMNLYFLRSIISTRLSSRSTAWTVICSVGGVGLGWWVTGYVAASPLVGMVVGLLGGVVLSWLLLVLVGEVTREDVQLLAASLRMPAGVGVRLSRLCWREAHPQLTGASDHPENGVEPMAAAALYPQAEVSTEIEPVKRP